MSTPSLFGGHGESQFAFSIYQENERSTIGSSEQVAVGMVQPGGTLPIIHVIQGGLVINIGSQSIVSEQ